MSNSGYHIVYDLDLVKELNQDLNGGGCTKERDALSVHRKSDIAIYHVLFPRRLACQTHLSLSLAPSPLSDVRRKIAGPLVALDGSDPVPFWS